MMNKHLSIILLTLSFFIGLGGVFIINYFSNLKNQQVLSLSTVNNASYLYNYSVKIAKDVHTPNAYQIKLTFDPNIVEVQKLSSGNLWTKTNILQSKIDNTAGVIKFAAGEGFSGKISTGDILFNIIVKPKKVSNPQFTISPESSFGYLFSGKVSLVPVSQESVVFASNVLK